MPSDISMAHVDIRAEDIEAVSNVLASGNLRQGRVVAEFETAFAARVGARHAVAVSSGTAALHLVYLALFRPGDEVIVPAFTFVATASMLSAVGAVPVFADVDPRMFTLSHHDARQRITERTRGIVGVHLFGNVCDIEGIQAVAEEFGLTVVWDAAQSLGSEWRGREVGSFATATCYSFYPTKNMTTGEGGMIVTNDDDLATELRLTRSQGAHGKYLHTVIGFNYRLTDFQAALGVRQLQRLDESLQRRSDNATKLTEHLTGVPGVTTPSIPDAVQHTFNQYSVLIHPPAPSRDVVRSSLAAAGIESAVHYPRALHQQPIFQSSGVTGLVTSESLCSRILALPVHPGLTTSDIKRIGTSVAAACRAPAPGIPSTVLQSG